MIGAVWEEDSLRVRALERVAAMISDEWDEETIRSYMRPVVRAHMRRAGNGAK
jgi:hypothetical protein